MSFSKFTAQKLTTSTKTLSKTTVARSEPSQFTPITASNNAANQLTPRGTVVTNIIPPAPADRTLDDTGTAVNRPTPVGR